jgi:hypothetical protein
MPTKSETKWKVVGHYQEAHPDDVQYGEVKLHDNGWGTVQALISGEMVFTVGYKCGGKFDKHTYFDQKSALAAAKVMVEALVESNLVS